VLIARGADIDWVAQGAATGGHVSTQEKQLYFFSQFKKEYHSRLVSLFSVLMQHIKIESVVLNRASRVSELLHCYGYPYLLAMLSTSVSQKNNHSNYGALIMLAGLVHCRQSVLDGFPFPIEIWLNIFKYVFEGEPHSKELEQRGFLTGRLLLVHQLMSCRTDLPDDHLAAVDDLVSTILATNCDDALADSVNEQAVEIKARDNPDNLSRLAKIFTVWDQRLNGSVQSDHVSRLKVTVGQLL
jgi:hypothetical protein